MADDAKVYLLCIGICFTVIVIATIVIAIFILRTQKKNAELEHEKQTLMEEKK